MRAKLWVAAGAAIAGAFSLPHAVRADEGYDALANWTALPSFIASEQAGLASSYSRFGDTKNDYDHFDNGDANQPDGFKLVRQVNGPGLITRFWMPHHSAQQDAAVRVFVDGQLKIDTTSSSIFGGTYGSGPQFRSPLVQTRIGGQVSYEPIPFQNSLVIESTASLDNFYQYSYRTLPAGSTIPSYNGSLTTSQTNSRNAVVSMINNVGQNPAGTAGLTTVSTANQSIAPASTLQLANLSGSGQIRGLTLHLPTGGAAPTDAQLQALHVRVKYDGATGYAIDVPLARFFGAGSNRNTYQSLPMGVKNGTLYCYWPMPFRSGATVELYNDGTSASAVPTVSTAVDYASGPVDPKAGYLHAVYQSEITTAGQTLHNVLHATGAGRYVGNLLFVSSPSSDTLEGNDLITVNGDTAHTMHGTGLEDAYNGGYYYNSTGLPAYDVDETGTTTDGPYSGLLFHQSATADQYRWLIGDYVPFTNGVDVNMENVNGLAGVTWGSTAFYYSDVAPEPASLGLMLAPMVGLLLRRRRKDR